MVQRDEATKRLAEQALAHVNPNRVDAAYMRSDLFELRRELMEAWSGYLSQQERTRKHRHGLTCHVLERKVRLETHTILTDLACCALRCGDAYVPANSRRQAGSGATHRNVETFDATRRWAIPGRLGAQGEGRRYAGHLAERIHRPCGGIHGCAARAGAGPLGVSLDRAQRGQVDLGTSHRRMVVGAAGETQPGQRSEPPGGGGAKRSGRSGRSGRSATGAFWILRLCYYGGDRPGAGLAVSHPCTDARPR